MNKEIGEKRGGDSQSRSASYKTGGSWSKLKQFTAGWLAKMCISGEVSMCLLGLTKRLQNVLHENTLTASKTSFTGAPPRSSLQGRCEKRH